jgi:SAM-dependent methyltransferase
MTPPSTKSAIDRSVRAIGEGGRLYGQDLATIQHVGFSDGARDAIPFLLRYLAEHGVTSGRVVDLGCGDGQWLRALLDAGYAAAGIELSPDLAAIARKDAPSARIQVGSVHEEPIPNCDAVTALGEVLGYIPPGTEAPPDLEATFRRIAKALRPRGRLIFDLYVAGPPMGARARSWRAGEDWAVLAETRDEPGKPLATRHIIAFRMVDGAYRRSEETHRLWVPDAKDVLQWLEAAGFDAEGAAGYGNRILPARRLAFFARRR